MSRARLHLAAWLGLAAALRLARAPARWDELALAYAAYTEPVSRLLERGELSRLPATWVGLHPPLHALLVGLLDRIAPAPALWIGLSALCSLGAVVALGRAYGPVAAAALGTAPLQLAYAGEVNNYPLATLAVAACLALARAGWGALAAAVVLAGWSHVLAGLAGLGVLAWRLARPVEAGERPRLIAAVALGLLPVGVGAVRRMALESTYGQAGLGDAGAVALAREALDAAGWAAAPLLALAVLGLRGPALAAALPLGLGLGAALITGAAAPHQHPYLLLLGPSLAVALATASRRREVLAAAVALCGLRGAVGGVEEIGTLMRLSADQARPRAVDEALRLARPGDLLWLVAPALRPDDDKTDVSPVLWRLSPWEAWWLPPPGLEQADPRYGAPRLWRGVEVHTSTTLDPAALDAAVAGALESGHALFVVLYEHGPAAGLRADVERALRPYQPRARAVGGDPELGEDWLYAVEGGR